MSSQTPLKENSIPRVPPSPALLKAAGPGRWSHRMVVLLLVLTGLATLLYSGVSMYVDRVVVFFTTWLGPSA